MDDNSTLQPDESIALDKKPESDDYDSPWKTTLDRYFPEFMAMYFPEAAAQIDWQEGYESLDTELRSLARDAELGKRFADKLVKVTLLNGLEELVYVHVEIQGNKEEGFDNRMFVYNYRFYDHYNKPVASFAVLADGNKDWRPTSFSYEALGCRVRLDFPMVKLADYAGQIDELLASNNPFAIITAAHLLTRKTRKDHEERYRWKQKVVRLLYEKGWDKQEVIDLFAIIDWMMHLPPHLTRKFRIELDNYEQVTTMRYITSVERLAMEEGELKGKEEGKLEGKAASLEKLITLKFGECSEEVKQQLHAADEAQLDIGLERILTATTVDEVFA